MASTVAAVEWSTGIESAWQTLANMVPKVIAFVVVLVVGLFIARIAARIVGKLAARIGVNRMVDRAGLGTHLKRMGFTGETALTRTVKFFFSFVALTTALSVFGPSNPLSQLINRFVTVLPRLVVAAAIVVITGMVARFVATTISRLAAGAEGAFGGVDMPDRLPQFASAAVWVIGTFAAIDQLGIAPNVTKMLLQAILVAIVGIAVVAVGGGGIVPMRARWEKWLAKANKA